MIIYDPPTADARRDEWERYVASLDWRTDSREIESAKEFIKMRFSEGFELPNLIGL